MAKRHVIRYFLEVEHNYVETMEVLKELQELANQGKVEESTYLNVEKDLEVIKTNYERIAYIIFLLNKPNRSKKEAYEEKINKSWYDGLKFASKEAIMDESRDALAHFKEIVKGVKDGQRETK